MNTLFNNNNRQEKESTVVTTFGTAKPLFSITNLWSIHKAYATAYNRRRTLAL